MVPESLYVLVAVMFLYTALRVLLCLYDEWIARQKESERQAELQAREWRYFYGRWRYFSDRLFAVDEEPVDPEVIKRLQTQEADNEDAMMAQHLQLNEKPKRGQGA